MYEGQWNKDKNTQEGFGIWSNSNEDCKFLIIGYFRNGKANGNFTWMSSTGFRLEGYFKENKVTGIGKFIRKDGVIIEGNWENAVLRGAIVITDKNGQTINRRLDRDYEINELHTYQI